MNVSQNSKNIIRRAFDSSKRYKEGRFPYIESHRGCNKEFPENTIVAFKRAIEIGCDSVEFDVWMTKDKIPVVIHGEKNGEIEDTTNGTGIVNELSLREISNFITHGNQPIPTLEEVILLCKDNIFMNIEIKDKNFSECFEKIINMIIYFDVKEQCAISSFSHQYWDEIKKTKDLIIEFGFLYEIEDKVANFEFDPGRRNNTINVWYKEINPDFVKKAHDVGLAVHCWFGMKDEENEEIYRYLLKSGVDVICTNSPEILLKLRNEMFES